MKHRSDSTRLTRPGAAGSRIPWNELDASGLDEIRRGFVATSWRDRAHQEHLAVGAFAILTAELAAVGTDSTLLALVARAASDEARHADICRRMADAIMGRPTAPRRERGLPRIPQHADASAADRVLYHMVEMCCLGETVTGVCLSEMLSRTDNRGARLAIQSLLADEIDHGRVGWAYLATRAAARRTDGLARVLPSLIARVFRRQLSPPALPPVDDDPALEAFGYLGPRATREQVIRSLADVIVPGFEALDVDLSPSRDILRELADCSRAAEYRAGPATVR